MIQIGIVIGGTIIMIFIMAMLTLIVYGIVEDLLKGR